MKKSCIALLFALPGLWASQANTPIGFGFANACAGSQYFSTLPFPGSGFSTTTDQYMNCSTGYGAPVSASVLSPASASFTSDATAVAGPMFIKVGASNTDTSHVPFAGAASNAGWNDLMTINGGTGSAVWVVPVSISGTLSATGVASLARLGVNAYENYNPLQPYGNSLNAFAYNLFVTANGGNVNGGIRNSAIGFSWDSQAAFYGAVHYSDNDPANVPSYTVNRTLYFMFPFTYGVQFEWGIYMGGVAGQNSSGAAPIASSFDFTHTLTWGGEGYVIDQNSVINNNFTLASGSGIDYSQAFSVATPEPATSALLTLALGALVWIKRRA
jgi:hypothetical protein